MSEIIQIGNSDAASRWIGIRKHQAVLLLLGVLVTGDWCLRPNATVIELCVGLFLLACSPQSSDGLTNGEWLLLAAMYLLRTKWSHVQFSSNKNFIELVTSGRVTFSGYSLIHRGRLDLSGDDGALTNQLKAITSSLALSGVTSHVSLHILCGEEENQTLLCVPAGTFVPPDWKTCPELAALLIGALEPVDVLERWGYTRTKDSLVRVIRLSDFSQASTNSAVHRISSDSAVTHEAGFRRTAQSERAFKRMRQREILVAQGLPLLRCAVYISICAPNQRELLKRSREVVSIAQDAGLRCQKGFARQAEWFRFQLPGGAGW